MLLLHEKYGRDHVDFNILEADDIKGHIPFVKSQFYDGGSFADEAHSIVSARDPREHADMRRYLSSAFSIHAFKEQEHLVAEVVDRFIDKIGERGMDSDGIDLTMWFNLATFDIIGSLAFGQSFGGLNSGREHFWVSIVVKALGMGALADCFSRFPSLEIVIRNSFPRLLTKIIEDTRRHEAYTLDLVKRRIAHITDRKDFLTKILEVRESEHITDVQIAAHSSDFVIAGSETTATALSCITYYLQKCPEVLGRLQTEIDNAFDTYERIDHSTTATLPYLNAIILEGMRIYPPLPFALPRVVPPGGDTVDNYYIPEGTIVSTNPFAASMSASNFEDAWAFKPERWLAGNNKDDLEASQPFSVGVRACLGRNLGWLELRTFLAKIHFRYDLKLVDPLLDWHGDSRMYTLWKKPKMKVVVSERLASSQIA
ncbi:benzoate 4-monooxygenase cytochrome P450 [Phlyctema vagabunda]|uniref:Benzoate 4-monooxygenase cytochrome P450 n=1 Tax=Phlyctema vagabunda TaxID=108571 RepID=A0ABR4P1S8_9HELO